MDPDQRRLRQRKYPSLVGQQVGTIIRSNGWNDYGCPTTPVTPGGGRAEYRPLGAGGTRSHTDRAGQGAD